MVNDKAHYVLVRVSSMVNIVYNFKMKTIRLCILTLVFSKNKTFVNLKTIYSQSACSAKNNVNQIANRVVDITTPPQRPVLRWLKFHIVPPPSSPLGHQLIVSLPISRRTSIAERRTASWN